MKPTLHHSPPPSHPTLNPSKPEKNRLHQFYYFLAAFDVLTVTASLFLSHMLFSIHEKSIENSSKWVNTLEDFEKLSSLAAKVNAPGNDVFDSKDYQSESQKLNTALNEFQLFYDILKTKASETSTHLPKASQLTFSLDQVDESMAKMVDEANSIFRYFSKGEHEKAGARMATMDRKFAQLNDDLMKLREEARRLQTFELEAEKNRAGNLRKFEYLFALIILFMVTAVTWHGHQISKKINESNERISNQERQLESNARLSSLGTMASGIAHEINNPLGILNGLIELSLRKIKPLEMDENTKKYLVTNHEKSISTIHRIGSIIRGLRSFSRDGNNDPFEKVKIHSIIEESLSLCQEKAKVMSIKIKVAVPEDIPELECRKVQISQVLVNLISNSIDALSDQKPTQETDPDLWIQIEASIHKDGSKDKLILSVTDSGRGIAPAIAKNLMTPFYTTKEIGKGTGLGLSIAMGIATSHAGKFYYDPTSKNTRFVLEIPIVQSNLKQLAA